MRIVIDLQGAQSESRYRGIGRYSMGLALGMARNAGEHEIWLVLSAALGGAIDDIRQAFSGLVPPQRIRVFDIPTPTAEYQAANSPRARAGELLREHAIAQLRPDAVLITSLFEGQIDDAVASVGRLADGAATAVVLHDLIPFLNPKQYLPGPEERTYYERKIDSLRRAGLLLANSEHSRQEAIDALGFEPERIVTISTAVDERFRPAALDAAHLAALRARFGIARDFLMCAPGGFDSRKNIDGLIAAYAMLPAAQRAAHQLVIAGKINAGERQRLTDLARRHRLGLDELVLTGYVSDADLIDLYRSTALFVFPSLHEGFGLPVLEAMNCGALVLGNDGTSIPEVVGNPEALFDGRRPEAIAERIARVLDDPALQRRLREHGALQARKFSWDHSARRAIAALEAHVAARAAAAAVAPAQPQPRDRPRIAFLSPLPPERTGIADYSVRVLLTLLPWYDVELIVSQGEVTLPPELAHLPRHPPTWLDQHPERYRHIVYQFGNSPFHSHMIGLLQRHPGVVVLHDFFLSSMLAYEQIIGAMPGIWTRSLLHSHGYAALQASLAPDGVERAKHDYPCNLEILQDASHVVVHSDYARQLAADWYGPEAGADWSQVHQPRAAPPENDRAAARRALGIADDAFVVCNFGFVAPTKHCLELLQAWLASTLHADARCHLVFVGANHGGDYGRSMTDIIDADGAGRVRISGWTDEADYLRYLQAADVGVQLRTSSRGETSATVLDCMIYGLPVIINANGSMAEFPHDAVWMLPDLFAQRQLVDALETLRADDGRRHALGEAGFALMGTRNSPERVGLMYRDALERDAEKRRHGRPALLRALLATPGLESDDAALERLARCAGHAPDPLQPPQLLVDVTTIARHDLKTGIERVVRNQLLELLQLRATGRRVEPVYLDDSGAQPQYRYARNYAARLLGIGQVLQGADPVVDVAAGDIYFCADYSPHAAMASARAGLYAAWRARGVAINFLIHDLLPVLRPEFFPPHADAGHGAWLECIAAEADRLICTTQAVGADLAAWLAAHGGARCPGQVVDVLHLGADLELAVADGGALSPLAQQVGERPSFLMVGTIEPRKGHLQALDAFEQLWAAGVDVNLVIVGREGWKPLADADRRTLPQIMQRLRASPELGRRLLWLDGIDDATLQQVYQAGTCLLFPSEGEGFGLPLIEAAHHGLPLLVRDLPVFRELAGDHAYYFAGMQGADLAGAVRAWLALHAEKRHPGSSGMTWLTWQAHARALLALLEAPAGGPAAPPAPAPAFVPVPAPVQAAVPAPASAPAPAPAPAPARQLLVDVSAMMHADLKTGIQRVVRSVLLAMLDNPPPGFRIEPVFSVGGGHPYRYARRFVQVVRDGAPADAGKAADAAAVDAGEGDVFLGLDLSTSGTAQNEALLRSMAQRGVRIVFAVYDLLPMAHPEMFPLGTEHNFEDFLRTVHAVSDGVVCISRAVADELADWYHRHGLSRPRPLELGWFHLGADIDASAPSTGLPPDADRVLAALAARPSFLMVGTVEPRKSHAQALAAFERLWARGVDVNLVVVGKQGWLVEQVAQRMAGHAEQGKCLFWLQDISDEMLGRLYAGASALLAPSVGEGFGLPLIEAAHHGIPVIARDLPVFREVAGGHAWYFDGQRPEQLAAAIEDWLALRQAGQAPASGGMPWLTWERSARQLLDVVIGGNWYRTLPGRSAGAVQTAAPAPSP